MATENRNVSNPGLTPEDSFFSKNWVKRQKADLLWNEGIEPGVEYGGEGDNLYSHLARIPGITINKLDAIFTREGNFKFFEGKTFSYEKVGRSKDGRALNLDSDLSEEDIAGKRLSLKGFFNVLKDRFEPVFDLINASADWGYEAGFNNHGGIEHTLPVTNTAWELIKEAGGTMEDQKLTIVAGMAHDLGMLLCRKQHNFMSSRIADALAPELFKDKKVATQIRRTIILHDEGFASGVVDILAKKYGQDTREFYNAMRSKFGLAALALVAADKADVVDRRRATRKPGLDTEGLMSDSQTAIAALADQRGWTSVPGENNDIATRKLLFSPYLSEVEMRELSSYQSKQERHKGEVSVPLDYRNLNRGDEVNGEGGGIPHFFSWMADIWKYHADRFGLEARSLFALFPGLSKYRLEVQDESAWNKVGFRMGFTYAVNNTEVEEFTTFLKSKMAFPGHRPRTEKTLPEIYGAEARRMRSLNVEDYVEAARNIGTEDTQIKRTLWKSTSGKSTLAVRYDFNVIRQKESLQSHIDKLFQSYVHRV